jgi:hypothetical protein
MEQGRENGRLLLLKRAGDSDWQMALSGRRSNGLYQTMTPDQTILFKRLIEYAHRQAMMRNGQIAQDIRLVLIDAARYWHLRDRSAPDDCTFFLATNEQRAANYKDSAWIDTRIDTDMANIEAHDRATKA